MYSVIYHRGLENLRAASIFDNKTSLRKKTSKIPQFETLCNKNTNGYLCSRYVCGLQGELALINITSIRVVQAIYKITANRLGWMRHISQDAIVITTLSLHIFLPFGNFLRIVFGPKRKVQ